MGVRAGVTCVRVGIRLKTRDGNGVGDMVAEALTVDVGLEVAVLSCEPDELTSIRPAQ